MIKRCPNLLQDNEINFMYNNIKNLDVAKLPEFYNVRNNIRVKKTNLGFTPSWTINPSLSDINRLIAVNTEKMSLDAVTASAKNQKIELEKSLIGEIEISNLTASNYKMALNWYLDYKSGLIPSIQRKAEIVVLAEDCLEFGSPGQEVAHYMCGLLELVYNNPSECGETRSIRSKDTNFKISPNPSSNFITLENLKVDQIVIFDVFGKLISNYTSIGENTIDISNFSNGVYFIKPMESASALKFIKI